MTWAPGTGTAWRRLRWSAWGWRSPAPPRQLWLKLEGHEPAYRSVGSKDRARAVAGRRGPGGAGHGPGGVHVRQPRPGPGRAGRRPPGAVHRGGGPAHQCRAAVRHPRARGPRRHRAHPGRRRRPPAEPARPGACPAARTAGPGVDRPVQQPGQPGRPRHRHRARAALADARGADERAGGRCPTGGTLAGFRRYGRRARRRLGAGRGWTRAGSAAPGRPGRAPGCCPASAPAARPPFCPTATGPRCTSTRRRRSRCACVAARHHRDRGRRQLRRRGRGGAAPVPGPTPGASASPVCARTAPTGTWDTVYSPLWRRAHGMARSGALPGVRVLAADGPGAADRGGPMVNAEDGGAGLVHEGGRPPGPAPAAAGGTLAPGGCTPRRP